MQFTTTALLAATKVPVGGLGVPANTVGTVHTTVEILSCESVIRRRSVARL